MPWRLRGPVPSGLRPENATFTALLSRAICRWMYFRRRSTRSSVLTITFYRTRWNRGDREARGERSAFFSAVFADSAVSSYARVCGSGTVVRTGTGRVEQIGRDELGRCGRADGAVAAARGLVAVHEVVRVGQELFVRAAVVREDGGAGADAEAEPFARPHLDLDLGDPRLQLPALGVGRLARAVGQHDDELVARVPHAQVVGAQRALERARNLAQRVVADVVAVGVVDRLEPVDVHHDDRDFALEALGACEFARQVHEHRAPVRQARQRIGQRIFLRLLEHDRVVDHAPACSAMRSISRR